MFKALRHRNFSLYLAGQGVSMTGTWIQMTAASWLLYRVGHSSFLLGLSAFCAQIPTFFFASWASVFYDRSDGRRILIATQILFMAQALLLGSLTFLGMITVSEIIALSLFAGLVSAVDLPARQSFLADMGIKKDDYTNAIALNSSLFQATRLLGPAAGGFLIMRVGEAGCFLINAVSFLAALAALKGMKIPHRKRETESSSLWQSWKAGLVHAIRSPSIWRILVLVALANLAVAPILILLPVIAKDILRGGPETLGMLTAASSLGALVTALFLARWGKIKGLGSLIALGACALGIILVFLSYTDGIMPWLLGMALGGAAFLMVMSGSNMFLQVTVRESQRSRALGLFTMAMRGTMPLASLVAGFLSSRTGVVQTLRWGGWFGLGAAALFAAGLPMIHQVTGASEIGAEAC